MGRRTGSGVVFEEKASFLLGSDEYTDLRETMATEGSELRVEEGKEDRELEAIQRAVEIVSKNLSQRVSSPGNEHRSETSTHTTSEQKTRRGRKERVVVAVSSTSEIREAQQRTPLPTAQHL